MTIYHVYWIHQPHHSDPLTEGYIGVSSKPDKRMMYHSCPSVNNNEILYRAIKKGAVQDILYSFESKEEAYAKEIELRPHERIGYNIIPGGDSKPPKQWGNKYNVGNHKPRHSEEFKESQKKLMSSLKWWTNGEKSIRIPENQEPPEGFWRGKRDSRSL